MRKAKFLVTIGLFYGSLVCATEVPSQTGAVIYPQMVEDNLVIPPGLSPITFESLPIGQRAPFSIAGAEDHIGASVSVTDPTSRIILSADGLKTFWVGQGSVLSKFDRSIDALSVDLECPLAPMDFIVTLLDEQGGAIYTHSYMSQTDVMSQTDICHVDVFPDQPFQTALITTSSDWGLIDLWAVSEK